MRALKTAAVLMMGLAFVAGCDKDDDKTTPPPVSAPKAPGEGVIDKMKDNTSNAIETGKEKTAEAMNAVKKEAVEIKDKTVEMKDSMVAKVHEATAPKIETSASAMPAVAAPTMTPTTVPSNDLSLIATAQKYYEQATSYIAKNDFTSASNAIAKLDGMRGQLPVEWNKKIDDLKVVYDKAKAGVGNFIPKM